MASCTPSSLEATLSHMVELHLNEMRKATRKSVQKAGRAAINELKEVSPKDTGKYAASWKQKISGNDLDGYVTEIYNGEDGEKGPMSAWLEFGHHLVYHGRETHKFVAPRPHIDAGFQAGKSELESQLGG